MTAPQSRPTGEYPVALLRRMVEIPSPSGQEAALAGFLCGQLAALGFRTHVDPAGNVVGEIGRGAGPTVMLLGHLDTVAGTPAVRLSGDRLYGRGTVDAKGPLAAMICAAAQAGDVRGRIVVIGVVEEETIDSRGARQVATWPAPDALIVGEPGGWSSIVLGYKGRLDIRYRVDRPAAHPTRPEPKAAELAVRAWTALLELLGPAASHAAFDRPGATLSSISGGLTSAEIELSVRCPPGFDAGRLLASLRHRLPAGELTLAGHVPACRVSRRDPVVRALAAGIRGQGATPTMKVKTGTSDMNVLAEVWGVPMATYGPGDGRLDHTDDEHIDLADYRRAISVLGSAIELLAAAAPDPAVPVQASPWAAREAR
jgi:LysW-gamma-L-lysine carboxypeptidase